MNKKVGPSYTSKGERPSCKRSTTNAVRRERTVIDKWMILQKAWLDGRNPWITIDNPNTNETNKRKIRVRAESEWGPPRPKINLRAASND